MNVLQEGCQGWFIQRDSQVLATVVPFLAFDQLVVPELCELGPESEVTGHQELQPALAVELHEGEAEVVLRLLQVLQLISGDKMLANITY